MAESKFGGTVRFDGWRDIVRTACLAVSVPVGCSGVVACQSASAVESAPQQPPAVHVDKAVHSESTRTLRLSGNLEAERSTTLGFAVMGTVEQVFVREGDVVNRGQVIARVSPRNYQDTLNIAKSKASQAEDAQRRLKPMYDNKTLPEVKMVEVETGLEQARLAVSLAAKNVADTVLRAPEAGVVARRSVEAGSSVGPGTPVVSIVQTRTVLAVAPVPETRVSKVKVGDKAKVFVAALNQSFEGTVRDIGVIADPLTRTYTVRVALPNPQGVMRVGMVAELNLAQATEKQAVVVPPAAVRVNEKGQPFLFVVKDGGLLEQRTVRVSGYVDEGTAIADGLADGESVVTSGASMLADKMAVRVIERKAEAK